MGYMAGGRHATTKTDFMRYLDANERAVPSLRPLFQSYHARSSGKFGFWLSVKHRDQFCKAYNLWWLRHPELWGDGYEDCNRRPSCHLLPA